MLIIFSFPLALLFGSLGLRYDRPKTLALICTLIAAGGICLYLGLIGMQLFCR